jgi:hypothetical protein
VRSDIVFEKETMTLEEIEMSRKMKNKSRMEIDEIIGGSEKWQELLV